MSDSTPILDGFKRCTKCEKVYPATPEHFYRSKHNSAGLTPICKECSKKHSRAWELAHPERVREKARVYRASHLEQVRRNARRWQQKNGKRVYAEKRELFRERRKLQYARERDKAKKDALIWYRANKARAMASATVNTQRRNTKKRSLPVDFSKSDWGIALAYFDNRCAVCGRPRGLWHTLAMDHWIPLSAPDCPGTVPTNIVPLCHGTDGCNNSKGGQNPIEWLTDHYSKSEAANILARIKTFFDHVRKNT